MLQAGADRAVIIARVNDIDQGRSAGSVQQQLAAMFDAARGARISVVAGTHHPLQHGELQ